VGESAIFLNNISKSYKRYTRPIDRLKEILIKPKYSEEFWALQNISFEVFKGETFGIIGRNGSGKSTLLQIIAGTLTPTNGEIKVYGRVAALLELGSGFNPEFTGRQNVFFNGQLLGLGKEEIEANFDDIVAFADIGDFLDQPVKTYSSGMMVRLAFAVQAHLSPDILIIDEALSVGDIFFQQKCSTYLEKLRQKGTTLLLVSHDMNVIQTLCRKAVLLNHGEMVYLGETSQAISKYYTFGYKIEKSLPANETSELEGANDLKYARFLSKCQWVYEEYQKDEPLKARILGVRFQNGKGDNVLSYKMCELMKVELLIENCDSFDTPDVALTLRNRFDQVVFCGGSYSKDMKLPPLAKKSKLLLSIELELGIEAGEYTIDLSLGEALKLEPNKGIFFHRTPKIGPILIKWDYHNEKAPFLGAFNLPCKVDYQHSNQYMY